MSEYNLASCPLFLHLPQHEAEEILEHAVSEVRTVDKGNYVVQQGDPIHYLYLLMEGLVRTEMVTKVGNVQERSKLEGLV